MDGSDRRTLGTTGKLQILQQIAVSSTEDGRQNPAKRSLVYLGFTPHLSNRLEESNKKSGKKEQREVLKDDSGLKKDEKKVWKKKEKLVWVDVSRTDYY